MPNSSKSVAADKVVVIRRADKGWLDDLLKMSRIALSLYYITSGGIRIYRSFQKRS